ncbi:hypothetical protein DUI87_13614 [Hirundo rustica rustica]|uniref:ribonuclease H n=1 Tax=Hirundo rustica rustica TaxID=333673 RepID=A0A3M0KRS3_HIRRU|nr:hypothetical protein DUI87_13614 [Hirundo rustica rustica]
MKRDSLFKGLIKLFGRCNYLATIGCFRAARGARTGSEVRFYYKSILLDSPKLTLEVTGLQNLAQFLYGEPDEKELAHNCMTTIEEQTKIRPDLEEEELETGERLFVDGSSRVIEGKRVPGYAIIGGPELEVIESGPLNKTWFAQACELYAVLRVLERLKDKEGTIYTDSKYAFGVVHTFGKIWEERGLMNSQGKDLIHQELIKRVLIALRKPKKIAVVHLRGHQRGIDFRSRGNNAADQEAKKTALMIIRQKEKGGPGTESLDEEKAEYRFTKTEEQRLSQMGICKDQDGKWKLSDGREVLPKAIALEILHRIHEKTHWGTQAIVDQFGINICVLEFITWPLSAVFEKLGVPGQGRRFAFTIKFPLSVKETIFLVCHLVSLLYTVCSFSRIWAEISREADKTPDPGRGNPEWCGEWEDMGQLLKEFSDPVVWDFPREQIQNPVELGKYLKERYHDGSKGEKMAAVSWALAYAYRTLLETVGQQTEAGGKGYKSTATPVTQATANTPVMKPAAKLEPEPELAAKADSKPKPLAVAPAKKHTVKTDRPVDDDDPREGPSPKSEAKASSTGSEANIDSFSLKDLRGLRKDYRRQPDESIISWLVRLWDAAGEATILDGTEARHLGSLSHDPVIDQEMMREASPCSLWIWVLGSVAERYLCADDLYMQQTPWKTIEQGIQRLREMAVAEMVFSDDINTRNPDLVSCTSAMWRKLIRPGPLEYASALAVMKREDMEETVLDMAKKLRAYADAVHGPTHARIAAVETRLQKLEDKIDENHKKLREEIREDLLQISAVQIRGSGTQRRRSPARERGYTPRAELWFFLRDCGENMNRWDGKSTAALAQRVRELKEVKTQRGSSTKRERLQLPVAELPGGSQDFTLVEAVVSLTGNEWKRHPTVTGPEAPCILGIDFLRNGYFKDPKGFRWAFGIAAVETEGVKQLNTLPGLSENPSAVGLLKVEEQQVPIATSIVHRRQYRTTRDAVIPIHKMIRELESQGVVSKTHSPFNSPIWPVRKSDGEWRLTVDYRALNEVTPPLSAAVPDMLELQYELESKAAKWYATIDIANAFFSIPLAAECRPQFAFTWRGVQYTWNRLPQGWKHSPTICHGLIQAALEKGEAPEHLQYIDDIIVWGNTAMEVFEKGEKIIQILLKAGFAIKKSKVKGPAREIQFLGVKWHDGRRQIPTEVINKITAMCPPTNKRETQAFLGAIGFWRMHIPEYSQIVSPLYLVTRKKNNFHWGPEQQQAFAQIKQEIAHAVALGPVRTGPDVKNVLYSAAGNNGLSWSLWQKVPGETRGRPLGFWSRSYRGSEANYTPTEKEILAAYEGVQAASEVVGTETQLLLAPRLPVLGWMFKAEVPSTHHATDATWSKWIALITQRARMGKLNRPGILEIITNWPEGENFGLTDEEQEQVTRAEEAPPYNQLPAEETHYALFTDGSCRIVGMNRKWKAAVWSPTRQVAEATEGEGGSSQLAELKAVQLALDIAEREGWPRLYLYTDSWMVANALWGWLKRVERLPVKVRHVDAHIPKSRANEEHRNNEQVDWAAKIEVSKIDLDWEHKGELFLARWAHDASGHQGRDATYKWARDRGVDLTMDSISQVIHDCETCAAIKQAKRVKPLWYGGRWSKYKYGEAWQIDYITLPQTRQGKRYVLTMVEATTGWLETYPVPHATARNTILGLEKQVLWRHGTPERIESDNGTHFKNSLINTWAREHGIEWVYHIPYHTPAAGKVERHNALLKTQLKALGGGSFKNWEQHLTKATWLVNT